MIGVESWYPIYGSLPAYCSRGETHHLHFMSSWDSGLISFGGRPYAVKPPERLDVRLASALQRTSPIVPIHKFVYISFDSTIFVNPPAEITAADVKFLTEATNGLNLSWSLTWGQNGSAKVDVLPRMLTIGEIHKPNDILTYRVESSEIVLAGLRLLALESVARYIAPLQ